MSAGNGRVPEWLAALGIKEGEYFVDSKLRWKRAMRSKCFSNEARVYACLSLHTMGFQQELAVKMEAGKKVPLTPTDIASETGLPRKHIREDILTLKRAGLADIKGSTKGAVEIYAWASPRPEIEGEDEGEGNVNCPLARGQYSPPEWLNSLYKRFRINVPEGFVPSRGYIEAAEAAARGFKEAETLLIQALKATEGDNLEAEELDAPETRDSRGDKEAEMVPSRALKGPLAPERIYKEERNEINIERNGDVVGRQVGLAAAPEQPTDLPTIPSPVEIIPETPPAPPPAEIIPDPRRDPAFREVIEVVEAVAVPVIGESPSDAQYVEIHRRLKGASPEHFRQRIEAKKAQGKLNSVMVLAHLADDCARDKDKWKPPKAASAVAGNGSGRKSFRDSVDQAFNRRVKDWGLG